MAPRRFAQHIAASSTDNGRLANISHNVLLTHEDKTLLGSVHRLGLDSLGSLQGRLRPRRLSPRLDPRHGSDRDRAARRAEINDTAVRALVYLACTQRTDGSFAQNFWIDGTPYWTGIQLDEVAFPIILAWRLWKLDGLGSFDVFPLVEQRRRLPGPLRPRHPAGALGGDRRLLSFYSCGRHLRPYLRGGYRPRTSRLELADFLETYADWIESHLDEWTTTTEGTLDPDVKYHYMRIVRPRPASRSTIDQSRPAIIHIANRAPGREAGLRGPRDYRRGLP